MRKTSLMIAILLLSAVWAFAQTSPSSSPQSTAPDASSQQQPTSPSSPSSTAPSQQPAAPDTSSTTTQTTTTQTTQTSSDSSNSIEGCLNGSAGNWTLTDQAGKTWQLSGDTSKLSDHVGHQVRVMGTDNSSSASGSSSPRSSNPSSAGATGAGSSSGSQSTFTVNKVKMISSSCPTTNK